MPSEASSASSREAIDAPAAATPARTAETPKPKKSALQTRRSRDKRAARTRARRDAARTARAPWGEQRGHREYIGGGGARYYGMPRSAYAYDDMPRRRLFIVRPGPFYDDD
jgi:hypothetical protein